MTEEIQDIVVDAMSTDNEIFNLPRIDEDGYYCGTCMCMNDPATGKPLLPPHVVDTATPEDDDKHFYKWDGSRWIAETKPTTCAECVALGAISHTSQTDRCNELRQLYQTLVLADFEHYKIVRGENLEWIVEAIPEKTEEEKLEELAEKVRSERDLLLSETDYLMASDYPIEEDKKAELIVYRQALRDVPEQEGFPTSVTWPEKPEWLK